MATVTQLAGLTGTLNDVNADHEQLVAPTRDVLKPGFVALAAEGDDGAQTGTRDVLAMEPSKDWRLRVGIDTLVFAATFSGTLINTEKWLTPVTTATITQTGDGFINLNAGASVASAAVARLTSQWMGSILPGGGKRWRTQLYFDYAPIANNECEWGAILHTGVAAPTDGCGFRYNTSGALECFINVNGVETSSVATVATTPVDYTTANVLRTYDIDIYQDVVVFWIENQKVAELEHATLKGVTLSAALPFSFRLRNSAVTSVAQKMHIWNAGVLENDLNAIKPWDTQQRAMGLEGGTWPEGFTTQGPAILWGNTAAPTARTMTNTAIADASHNVLTGQFQVNIASLTAQTDYIANLWQCPVGTAQVPGRPFKLTSFYFGAQNGGAASLATEINFLVALGIGATAATLVTVADTSNVASPVKCARRRPIGVLKIPGAAIIGAFIDQFDRQFPEGLIVQPGEYVHVILKPMLYTTTASQTLIYQLNTVGNYM